MNPKIVTALRYAAIAVSVLFQVAAWTFAIAALLALLILILFAQPGGLL